MRESVEDRRMANKKQALYYNMRGREFLEEFISDFVSLLTQF